MRRLFIIRHHRVLITMLVAVALMASCADDSATQPDVSSVHGSTMGTSWRLLWVDDLPLAQRHELNDVNNAISAELERINALMSTWNPDSELSIFNATLSVEPVALHSDTLKVIDTALSISRFTHGSYDITLQPVIKLWGFSDNTAAAVAPSESDIADALEVSGYRQLVRVGNTVRKRQPELAIDVSSVAKGFAVDKLGEVVESLGITRYLVDIGGEIRARGNRAEGLPWRVGVETPEGEVAQILALQDAHIASSGSYRNYRIEDGKRLSHIIDGVTGRPVEHNLVSASVVHDSTMLADVWATALLVVGVERASELIKEHGLVAQLTVLRDGMFQRIPTAEFDAMLVSN